MTASRLLAVVLAALLVASASFVVDAGGGRPDPVPFEDTAKTGMTATEVGVAEGGGHVVPTAQVFYEGYRYVVGYYGIGPLVDALGRPERDRPFGPPVAVYVRDFAGSGVEVDPDGALSLPGPDEPSWVAAGEAAFVVGSDARTPAGPAVVPFSSRSAADRFASAHGGRVVDWRQLRELSFGTESGSREALRRAVAERRGWANRTVASARDLLDRPTSTVVGEDAPTLAAAVEAAPPNTTVLVPAGTYATNLTVEKPVTIRGVGPATHLRGEETGSVLRVNSPGVAVADLRITGVGNATLVEEVPGDRVAEGEWDRRIQQGYAYGDAGIEFDRANGSLVRGVRVETPASGFLVRRSDGLVVDGVAVNGSADPYDGFMRVKAAYTRIGVQGSTVHDGRDGVYTHRADGIVVRDNRMRSVRFGVHEMFTSDALLAGNVVRDASVGLIVMTRPSGNALVGNDLRGGRSGLSVAGEASYVAGNTLAGNTFGMSVLTRRSLWERNVVAGNEVGARAGSLVPTNAVVDNDFLDNDRQAVASLGPRRVWTGGGGGNYWLGAPGGDRDGDGYLERTYHPTGPVDAVAHRVVGAGTLARSPALTALRTLQGTVPGLRSTGVVDTAPRASPARPEAVARLLGGESPSNVTTDGTGEDARP